MRRVIIESPYAGDVERNVAYARRAMLNSIQRNEAPFASHLLYPQVLDDNSNRDRAIGIDAGLSWGDVAEAIIVYTDYGISPGMASAISYYQGLELPIEYRRIGRG